jgi:peptidyl-tRNA hydrolase, PTH2 family
MNKQVIVIRKDLNMRKGKMVAQGSHACMKVFFDRIEYCDHGEMKMNNITPEMEEWINGLFTKICVSVDSEQELLDIYNKAKEAALPCALVEDAGLTEFCGNKTLTCCAIGPANDEKVNLITGHLKLL